MKRSNFHLLTHSGGPFDGLLLTFVMLVGDDGEGKKVNAKKFMRDLRKVPRTAWINVDITNATIGQEGVSDVIHALADEGFAIMLTDSGDSRPQYLDKVAWRESFTTEPVGNTNVLRIAFSIARDEGIPNLRVPVVIHCGSKDQVIEATDYAKQNPLVRILRVSENGAPRPTVMINMEETEQ